MREICKKITGIFILFVMFSLISGGLYGQEISTIYKIKISENIMTNPPVMMAWQMYAKFKQEWRKETFFQQFPNEIKYRYSYKEELDCRKRLAEYWMDFTKSHPETHDEYLDELVRAYNSIYFPEYIYKYFRESSWEVKKDRFRLKEFKQWAKENLRGHTPKTYAHLEKVELN